VTGEREGSPKGKGQSRAALGCFDKTTEVKVIKRERGMPNRGKSREGERLKER
jgi:hypothetical protein